MTIPELSGKISFLKNLVIETARGDHDDDLKSPREEVVKKLNEFIDEGEQLLKGLIAKAGN